MSKGQGNQDSGMFEETLHVSFHKLVRNVAGAEHVQRNTRSTRFRMLMSGFKDHLFDHTCSPLLAS